MFRVYSYWQDSFVISGHSLANLVSLNNSTRELKLWWRFVILPGHTCASPQQSQIDLLPTCFLPSQENESLTTHPGKPTHSSWQASPVGHKKSYAFRQNHFSLREVWLGNMARPQITWKISSEF